MQVDATSTSLIMELPHNSFWIEASEDMPVILKERCIAAVRKIHSHGVLHGDIELRHLLVGGDGRVTVIDFQESRARVPQPALGLDKAEDFEFEMECRRLKYKLNYGNAREVENKRYVRGYRRREAEERRGSGLSPNDETSDVLLSEDDIHNPAPTQGDWETRWAQPVPKTPARSVVPGQTEAQLKLAVGKFMEELETTTRRPSKGAAASCDHGSAVDPERVLPTQLPIATRKRKSHDNRDSDLAVSKRVRTTHDIASRKQPRDMIQGSAAQVSVCAASSQPESTNTSGMCMHSLKVE